MAKGVKFPDIVRHENPAYPIVDSNDVRGLNIYAVNFSDVDLSEISGPRRTVGHILSCTNAMYQYVGDDTSDAKWNNKDNWRCVQTSTEGGFSYIKVVVPREEVENEHGSDDSFIACAETQGVYKYVSDATSYIEEYGETDNKILKTKEGGNTRYVDISLIPNSSEYFLLKSNNLSDVDDRQAAIDNLCIDGTVESGQFLYYDGTHMSFKSLPDIMTFKGRVDTVEDLYELTNVSVGDVYLVGDEEYVDDLEEYVCVSTEGSSPEWECLGKKAPIIQSDWEEDDATSPAHVLNRPAIRKGAGTNSIIEGDIENNVASGDYSHAEGSSDFEYSYVDGDVTSCTEVSGKYNVVIENDWEWNITHYNGCTFKVGDQFVENVEITYDDATGISTFTLNGLNDSYEVGDNIELFLPLQAIKDYSHAEGYISVSSGNYSHAEGKETTANGEHSHSEGGFTIASGGASHAEGYETIASGEYSHAEGYKTIASRGSDPIARCACAHAEGAETIASGDCSHAEGTGTIANHDSQHVFGTYNIADPSSAKEYHKGNYIEIVGNGTSENARSNARTLDWQGNETLAGNLTVNGTTLTVNGQQIEPQMQSDWNQSTTTAKDYIKNKPTKTSDFTNDGSDGTSTYVEADELATVATTGDYDDLENTPTNLSDFNNDEGFIDNTVNDLVNYYTKSETYNQDEVDQLISAATKLKILVVEELPEVGDTSTIYLVPISGSSEEDNVYEEYIYIIEEEGSSEIGRWEMIGTAQVDLSDYMQKSNNLNDVADRQTALNNLTGAGSAQAGKYLKVDNNGDIVFGNVDPQLQADWSQSDSTAVDYIKNKPTFSDIATSGNYYDLEGATSSDEGKILSVNSQGVFNLIDRFETGAGMVANEVSIHDHRTDILAKEYVPLMKLYHRNAWSKLQIEFSVVSADGSSPRFYGRYMFIRCSQYNPEGKLYALDFFSEDKTSFDYDDVVAVDEPVPSGVEPVDGQYYACTTIYRKNIPYPNWAAYCIHSTSTYTYDGERGYVVPVFYVGYLATFLKDGEVRLTDNDAKYYSDFATIFPCEDATAIEIDEPLTSQEIDNILT